MLLSVRQPINAKCVSVKSSQVEPSGVEWSSPFLATSISTSATATATPEPVEVQKVGGMETGEVQCRAVAAHVALINI